MHSYCECSTPHTLQRTFIIFLQILASNSNDLPCAEAVGLLKLACNSRVRQFELIQEDERIVETQGEICIELYEYRLRLNACAQALNLLESDASPSLLFPFPRMCLSVSIFFFPFSW